MRRLFKWLIVLGILGGGGYALSIPVRGWFAQRAIVTYLTAKVTVGKVETVVNSTGTVKPVRTVSVGSFVSGPIKKVFVDFNSSVTKDQLLAEIDPRLQMAALERDQAILATQQAEKQRVQALLQQAINNEERARKLKAMSKSYLSDTEMDQYAFTRQSLEAQLQLAEAAIKQAEASLKNSKANLDYTRIEAPEPGFIIERKVDVGQTVASSFQTPELFVLAIDLDKTVHVFASVDEADIGQIAAAKERNKPVSFSVDAYPQELFTGSIFQIRDNYVTQQNVVTYPVVIVADNPGMRLMPGMTANLSFQIEAKENVKRIPSAALRFVPPVARVRAEDRHHLEGGGNPAESGTRLSATQKVELARGRTRRIVWVEAENNELRAVPVILGLMNNQFAEVIEGEVQEGTALVTQIEGSGGRP